MEIRFEIETDFSEVRDLHLSAFPAAEESDLVDALRKDGDAVLSLVADDGGVVGHVMFSRMKAPFRALGLAPVAVLADWRRQGVADGLIRAGLARAKNDGWEAVFVLGSPDYYTRFGFDVGLAAGFQSPYAGPYMMVLALQEGGLPTMVGEVSYAPAFDGLD
jgi:putative acetyltransferase